MSRIQPERVTDTHAFFWDSLYSQWFTRAGLFKDENGTVYPNAEKYMMMKKAEVFSAQDILEKMENTDNPRVVKQLGRQIENFSDEVWDKHKIDVVTQASYLKFVQNPDLLKIMMQQEKLILVEASPEDKIWGIGLHPDNDKILDEQNWNGQNLLGICLMKARQRIKDEQNSYFNEF